LFYSVTLTESYWSSATEYGQALQRLTVVLVKPRTMSKSNSQPKESTASDSASGRTELHECIVCGAVGLSERISNHDCEDFLAYKEERR